MAIKIYSDKTNKFYDSVEAANKAEFELKEQENRERIRKEREAREKKEQEEKVANERKTRAQEIEVARKAMVAAQNRYKELLEAFVRDYKTYHYSIDTEDVKKVIPTLFEIFNPLFFD